MNTTRLMDRLFSATEKSESGVLDMMERDFSEVLQNGTLETDELIMRAYSDGSIEITDKETGEKTLAEPNQDEEGNTIYDLSPVEEPTEQLEGELHPEVNAMGGVNRGKQTGTPDERVKDHMTIEQQVKEGVNPRAGEEPTVEENAEGDVCPECGKNPCDCDEEKKFTSKNEVIQRIYSDVEFCVRVFSEVIESEETAKVGDLKVEKLPDEENAVVVTSESTGDQAKVELRDGEMEVTELESKALSRSFSEEGEEEGAMEYSDENDQYLPYFIVGVEPINHIIASTYAYDEESAYEIARRLTEDGLQGVEILEDEDAARDYADQLLSDLDATEVEEEAEEAMYSDMEENVIYLNRYFTDTTYFMDRCFSETLDGVSDMQYALEDVINNQEEVKEGETTVTPVDEKTAVISEGGEFTKVTLEGEDKMCLENISKEEYEDLTDNSSETEDQKVYSNQAETKFFSENEYLTTYMQRLFSEEASEKDIEEAIEKQETKEVENDTTIIPVSETEAIVKDESGDEPEYSIAVLNDETVEINPIDAEEAEDMIEEKEYSGIYCDEAETRFFSENEYLTDYMQRLFTEEASEKDIEEAIEKQETKEVENDTTIIPVSETEAIVKDESGDEPEYSIAVLNDETVEINPIDAEEAEDMIEEKEYSGIYCDEAETRFFSENEYLTDYMQRLFTDSSDSAEIEKAIEEDKVIENDTEKITPIDEETAIIEDKENGEFTKATMDEEKLDVEPIDEEEAMEMIEEKEEKSFTYVKDPMLDKFFTDALGPKENEQPQVVQAVVDPKTGQLVPYNPEEEAGNPQLSVEAIEDKALAAIQSIQAAVNEGEAQILNAKAAPAENQEQNLQEAQFSESETKSQDTLLSWLENNIK